MFKATLNRGFKLNFENGVSISVQWGYGNYCSNRDLKKGMMDPMKPEFALGFESETAEVLIEKGEGNPITPIYAESIGKSHDGLVCGWLTADEVVDAISWAKRYSGE